jgi:MFS transporter, ACS family, hexuronate transporter
MNHRWIIAGLLCLSTMINYVDRQAVAVVQKEINAEFGMTASDYGHVVAMFMFAYAIMYGFSGSIVDRFGAKRGAAFFISLWSLAQMAHAFTVGKWSLAGARFALGLTEPGNWPAAAKAVKEWFPPERRALGIGIFNAGSSLGATIATPLIGSIALAHGWRAAFLVTGSFGFVWLIAWLTLYRTGPYVETAAKEEPPKLLETLRHRGCWTLIVARFLTDPVLYFMLFWLPPYLRDERGFDLAMVTKFAWIPFVFADIGYLLGGWLSGWLIDRGFPIARARKRVMLIGALCMPPAMLAPVAPEAWMAIAATCFITFGHSMWVSNELTIPTDIFRDRAVGTASGFSGMGGAIGGVLANLGTGYVVQNFSYAPVFVCAGLLHPLAMLVVATQLPDRLFPTTQAQRQ